MSSPMPCFPLRGPLGPRRAWCPEWSRDVGSPLAKLVLGYVSRTGGAAADTGDGLMVLVDAFGDDLHDALREVASAGPVFRNPDTGVVIALRHADVDALGRDPRLVGAGVANFDVMGIGEGPLRAWYGSLMFTNEGDV